MSDLWRVLGAGVLLMSPLLLLGIHIYRDWRGERRNRTGRCYACGVVGEPLERLSHVKGGSYLYCVICKENHVLLSRSLALVFLVVGILFLLAMGLAND